MARMSETPRADDICPATGKAILTKSKAKSTVKRLDKRTRKHERSRRPTDAYRCDECGGWHVGRRPWWR